MRFFIVALFAAAVVGGIAEPAFAAGGCASISVHPGAKFTIPLAANHSTGYRWKLDHSDTKVVEFLGTAYVASPHPAGMMGAPGTERWVFRAVARGSTTLRFSFVRPWETHVTPARRESCFVLVR